MSGDIHYFCYVYSVFVGVVVLFVCLFVFGVVVGVVIIILFF